MVLLIAVLWTLKAYMFYVVVKIFLKINFVHPFGTKVGSLIAKISYVALAIGILALIATEYSDWFNKKGILLPTLPPYVLGSSEFIFFAGIIFIISLVFKRGIEIQSENELTV
jgi:hypothetical protein